MARALPLPTILLFVFLESLSPARAEPLIADLSNHLIAITTGFTGTDVLLFGATDGPGDIIALVPVAAILVAGIRLNFLSHLRDLDHDGPKAMACDAAFHKGDEMGWFEHGSTILVFAPKGFVLAEGMQEGVTIRMGQPLMRVR